MSNIHVQASFNAGEWAPSLHARVDLQKYTSAAALLENFFVDYRGGASTRPGTEYVIQAYKSTTQVRLIPFQASFLVGYVIEFGNGYIRFIYQGAPITETPLAITAATQASPCVITVPGHTYIVGDWIFVSGVGGMTQLNNRYFIVRSVVGNNIGLNDQFGNAINSTGYGAYTSGGTAARIYTIASPYTSADDLRQLKYAQSVNQMVICHPNHAPHVLTIVTATNWTLVPITFGATISAPTSVSVSTTLGAGTWYYSYAVTTIDSTGQESAMSPVGGLSAKANLRTTAGSNQITWPAVQGAAAYNIYESNLSNFGTVPFGVEYGFVGTCLSTTFVDSNIIPNFAQTPPVAQNPFVGSGVDHVNVGTAGAYTTVPTVSFGGTPAVPATALVQLQVTGTPTITAAGTGYVVGESVQFGNSLVMTVATVGGAGDITSWTVNNPGAITSGSTPTNPVAQVATSGAGTGATLTATWGVGRVIVLTSGAGYTSVPAVSFSSGAATATAFLGATSNGNPTVPGFVQQRLVLAGAAGAPATFHMSRPAQYFNFDISNPTAALDAITATLVSGTLDTIRAIVGSAAGMIILTDKAAWLVNGGSVSAAITPTSVVANPQSWVGSHNLPPIVANSDILFVQAKGSVVRTLTYNVYMNIFTGVDITVLSSHLFYGFSLEEWTWAEQPFYLAQAIRDDGVLLSLTYLKDQDFIGWSHYVTNGLYKSICSVTETLASGVSVDAVYVVVQRTIQSQTVQYIERFVERTFPDGYVSAWCVDSGLQYTGTPVTTITGAEHLAGLTVTGLADGAIITPFVMPADGTFTLATAASTITVGQSYTCKLQTLPLDIGEPSIQGKPKKIAKVDIRLAESFTLAIGSSFSNLVLMKDTILGNVSSQLTGQSSQIITDLVTGDAQTILDPTYTIPGQFCIQQSFPYPATILGVFPRYAVENPNER